MEKRIRGGKSSVVRVLRDRCGLKASPLLGSLAGRKSAFTMAEILLSLTIIGVVAAITLPSLTGNINERTWNTQRKALFARMSQAISLMDSIRGYGNVVVAVPPDPWFFGHYSVNGTTEAFLTAGLAKVFKLNNICDSTHIMDCGMPNEIINLAGSKMQINSMHNYCDIHHGYSSVCGNPTLNGDLAAFETQNGESVLAWYNPVCMDFLSAGAKMAGGTGHMNAASPLSVMCVNFIYDLNGKKGPNTVNKDVGVMTVFYPTDPVVVAPVFASKNASDGGISYSQIGRICSQQGEDWRPPNKEELMSMHINYKFIEPTLYGGNYFYWYSSSKCTTSSGQICHWDLWGPSYLYANTSNDGALRCVKR